jgi:hypothetical protein
MISRLAAGGKMELWLVSYAREERLRGGDG